MILRYVAETHPDDYLGKVCFNPNYPSNVRGTPFGGALLRGHEDHPKMRAALEESVKNEGFRNPILAYKCDGGFLLKFGNSRLQIARKLGIPIPALVVDHTDEYADCPEVTMDNFHEFFTDVPKVFEIREDGTVNHSYNLGHTNQPNYDPAGFTWLGDDPDHVIEEFPQIDRADYLQTLDRDT